MKRFFSSLLICALVLTCFSAFFTVSAYEVDVNSPLYQKSALFVGDSICEAIYERNNNEPLVGWAGRILAWNGMTGVNAGISGASLSTCRGTNRIINQLSKYAGQSFDYVIIEGGVNDAWDSVSLGSMTAGFNDNYDSNTFAGALEEAFKYTRENFPNATMGFIISFQMPAASYGKLSDMSEYFTLAKQICDKWSVPYLDFYFDQNFNNNVLKPSTKENLYDYIHPNTAGYEILSPRINSWMKTLSNIKPDSANLAIGKTVTVSGTETTDGTLGPALAVDGNMSTRLSLARDKDEQWVTVDLGAVSAVKRIELAFYKRISTYKILVSKDNVNFTEVYSVSGLQDQITVTDEIVLDTAVEARYVKYLQLDRFVPTDYPNWGEFSSSIYEFRIFAFDIRFYQKEISQARSFASTLPQDSSSAIAITSAAAALEEYIATSGATQSQIDVLYGNLKSAIDSTERNVALNKKYTISGTGTGYGDYTANLTDGYAPSSDAYDNSWFAFYNGTLDGKNTVDGVGTAIIDLEGRFDISKVRVFMRNETGSGIYAPEQVSVSVSDDGVSYTRVGSLVVNYTDNTMYWAELDDTATGKYIKLDFTLASNFVFLNEIEVYGVATTEPEVLKGDLNNNGEIDAVDYTLQKRAYFGTFAASNFDVSDINGNGEIDAVDYTLLKRVYFGTYVIR